MLKRSGKNYHVAGKQTCIFLLVAHCLVFQAGEGGMHMARGGMHRGGRGDARASYASPLGTPLVSPLSPPASGQTSFLCILKR